MKDPWHPELRLRRTGVRRKDTDADNSDIKGVIPLEAKTLPYKSQNNNPKPAWFLDRAKLLYLVGQRLYLALVNNQHDILSRAGFDLVSQSIQFFRGERGSF